MVIASIGPTTSERLRDEELPVDIEASHPKMGHLVQDSAAQAAEVLARKSRFSTPPRTDDTRRTERRAPQQPLPQSVPR